MTRSMNRLLRTALATVAGLVCLFGSETLSLKIRIPGSPRPRRSSNPLTLERAGVARRTTRRATGALERTVRRSTTELRFM
jgi:hypothetical protein